MQTTREISISYGNEVELPFKKIYGSSDAHVILKKIWEQDVDLIERFYVLLLNQSNQVIGYKLISMGGITGTVVDPRIIFSTALASLATGIIIAHNHPSGSNKPSQADKLVTNKLKEGGKLLEINLLDHIIITEGTSYFSFADEGIL